MTSSNTISLAAARALAVHKQALAVRPLRVTQAVLLDTIRKIGVLQLDTINVVARSHYLVMLSRVGPYDPAGLDALLYPDRALFEQEAHAACLIPIEHYPYFEPVIHERRQNYDNWHNRMGPDPDGVVAEVLSRITAEGPLKSADFEDPRANPGTWWDWKPAKRALDMLLYQGRLMVERRVNFHRYYDLTERVLPPALAGHNLAIEDWRRWATLRSVSHLGAATASQIADYYRQKRLPARAAIAALQSEGLILPVTVEGWREPAYICPEDEALLNELEQGRLAPGVTALLSPFDNLIWDRRRTHDLFGFDYRIEVYTPLASKTRKYGYYVLPILHRGQLIGRLDPKADRKARALILHAVYLESGVEVTDELVADVADAIAEFAAFHHCETVRIGRSDPPLLQALLYRGLASRLEDKNKEKPSSAEKPDSSQLMTIQRR